MFSGSVRLSIHAVRSEVYSAGWRIALVALVGILSACASMQEAGGSGGGFPHDEIALRVVGESGGFEGLLQRAGVPREASRHGAVLSVEEAESLLGRVVSADVRLGEFGPRLTASWLLREVVERVDETLRPIREPTALAGAVHDDFDLISRSLDGAQDVVVDTVMGIGGFLTDPIDSLQGLQTLLPSVAALIQQAKRQFDAARGVPIQWHVAERKAADAIRVLLKKAGYGAIEVIHTPALP